MFLLLCNCKRYLTIFIRGNQWVKRNDLDLDTGVDDALALAYAVADPEVDLIGIASYGNNLLDVCGKCLKLLNSVKPMPVYKGLPHSSTTDSCAAGFKDIHGNNGIGDAERQRCVP